MASARTTRLGAWAPGAGAVLVTTCMLLSASGCGATSTAATTVGRTARAATADASIVAAGEPSTRFFSPQSFWNEELPADAPLNPASATFIAAFTATIEQEIAARRGPWINTSAYSVPIYTVPRDQPTVRVRLQSSHREAPLSAAWRAVPLPANAQPALGTDGILAVWQPSTGRLWEFWRLAHDAHGWHASWGGAIRHVPQELGAYRRQSWPGANARWGASASSLSLLGGLITLQELKRGRIEHALEIAIPEASADVYSSPAHRSDGASQSANALPEGAHLRLDPNVNLAALHLPPLTRMIAEAAQRYGILITDSSPIVEFYAQDPTPTGTDPYHGGNGYFEGQTPAQLLASFPWGDLELLPSELHRNTRRT